MLNSHFYILQLHLFTGAFSASSEELLKHLLQRAKKQT